MPPELGKQNANAKSNSGSKGLGEKDSGLKKSSSELVFKECDELEEELAALKVAYEQYFLGNERLAPARAHDDFKKRLMKLKTSMVRNTAAKFRMNSLHNKFLTYERMWQRTLQEIEAGTYKRDLFKAKRRSQKGASANGERRQEAHELMEEELSDDDLVEVAPLIPNEPVPVKPAKPAFIPRPVDDTPTFRPLPTAAAVPAVVPVVPTVPTVAPVASGTPFRGTPAVAATPPVPAIPTVAPAVSGAPRAGAVAPAGSTPSKGTPAIPSGATPSKGTPTIPPVATPSRGTAAVPPGGTPSKGTAAVPPGGTPSKGTPTLPGTPARGVPTFGAPSQGSSGIAAALESLTDEPVVRTPPASTPARPAAPATARPTAAAPGARPGAPAAPKPATGPAVPKPAAASGAGGLSDDKLKAVYDAYVTAKRRNQEDTSKMSYESVAANLRKQVPELLKQSGAKSVEFKVVIKDGKATLKAVPK
jgi:hypothetical protein